MSGADAAAAIIAGGSATRLSGALKPHLVVDGQRIIDRQLSVLRERFAHIAIMANDPTALGEHDVPVIPDATTGQGPLAGIAAALAWSPAPRVFALGGDMPFPNLDVIDLLLSRPGDLVVPVIGGRPEPLCAVYSVACAPAIERRLATGRRKAAALVDDVAATRIQEGELRQIDPTLRFLVNVNTTSDLKNATASVQS